jgi:hypothetical protein
MRLRATVGAGLGKSGGVAKTGHEDFFSGNDSHPVNDQRIIDCYRRI